LAAGLRCLVPSSMFSVPIRHGQPDDRASPTMFILPTCFLSYMRRLLVD
jgi:hypothetical protein